jgi:hypothetical protein
VHHYQSLTILVELAVIGFIFQFIVLGIAKMLVWHACVIMSRSV